MNDIMEDDQYSLLANGLSNIGPTELIKWKLVRIEKWLSFPSSVARRS